MKNKFRIGITDDTNTMRCRLIVKLVKICGATPVLIPTNLNNHLKIDNNIKNEQIEELLNKHLDVVDTILESCNALIFPGNKKDIHPTLYGEDFIHPQTKKRLSVDPYNARQITEIRMIEYALKKRDIPILGICGGMQIVNVAMGGKLIQHLEDIKDADKDNQKYCHHYDDEIKNFSEDILKEYENNFEFIVKNKKENIFKGTHEIKVMKDSLLAKIYKKNNPNIDLEKIKELSIHHQGCFAENLSNELKISAIAPDGVIEAVEHKNYPKMFLLTQFHPECNASGIALSLLEELIRSI